MQPFLQSSRNLPKCATPLLFPAEELVVQVVTAKSEYELQCADRLRGNTSPLPCIRESVTISADGHITVIIDTNKIDDSSTGQVISMVSKAVDELDGDIGTVYFGESLFATTPWITYH